MASIMEMSKLRTLVVIFLAVGLVTQKSASATFKDCYAKCFVFCMIEPAQTLCSCTTQCFKECIFQQTPVNELAHRQQHSDDDTLGFCKLGCAFAKCSTISTNHNPNGDKVDDCVGSCSTRCTSSFSSP